MRLFGYYALHSFLNQLKKLLKTWVMVFLACCVAFGVIIGLLVATLEKAGSTSEDTQEELMEMESSGEEQEEKQHDTGLKSYLVETIGKENSIELGIGAVAIIMLIFFILNADKIAGKLFLPADVALLFSSPMRPQTVMMFRLAMQLGSILLMAFYLLFQLPNLILNMGLSVWAAFSAIGAFLMITMFGILLQLLIYTLGSISETFRKYFRFIVYAGLFVIAGSFVLFQKMSGLDYLSAAAAFFNGRISRLIPIWGWTKGVVMSAVTGNVLAHLMYFAITLIAAVLMVLVIWNLKADFYEDAMTKSEEVAEAIAAAKAQNKSIARLKRKKDRSDKLKRDDFKKGAGANVYFYKSMYNRFRFAHFGILTKTLETNLVAAIAVAVLFGSDLEASFRILPVMIVLAAIAFFRSLGNQVEEDTQMCFFMMIPENTWAKLFWSLAGVITNAFLDLLLPVVVAAVILKADLISTIIGLLMIVSVYIYSTMVGVFISVSVPTKEGVQIKTFVQILFVYFGLIPDAIVMTISFIAGAPVIGFIFMILINLALGGLFFCLSPIFLEPCGGKHIAKRNNHA